MFMLSYSFLSLPSFTIHYNSIISISFLYQFNIIYYHLLSTMSQHSLLNLYLLSYYYHLSYYIHFYTVLLHFHHIVLSHIKLILTITNNTNQPYTNLVKYVTYVNDNENHINNKRKAIRLIP